jgi:truncated hemoglobin YjbI
MRCRAHWLVFGLLVAGCMEGKKEAPLPRTPSLYTRMGGTVVLEKVVDRFVARASTSTELREPVRDAFRNQDAAKLKQRLVRRFGAALGGPYPGTVDDLGRTIRSLGEDVTSQDMGVLLGILDKAVDDEGVGPHTRKEVMTTLAPVRNPPVGADDKV